MNAVSVFGCVSRLISKQGYMFSCFSQIGRFLISVCKHRCFWKKVLPAVVAEAVDILLNQILQELKVKRGQQYFGSHADLS